MGLIMSQIFIKKRIFVLEIYTMSSQVHMLNKIISYVCYLNLMFFQFNMCMYFNSYRQNMIIFSDSMFTTIPKLKLEHNNVLALFQLK